MTDPLASLFAHPCAVAADILGQATGAGPTRGRTQLGVRVNRRPACEARRKLDERLGDEHGDRVRVAGSDVEAEPLRFERDGTATRERVEHWRRPVGARDEDLLLGLVGVLGAISGMFGMADYLWATGCPGLHGTEGYAPLHHEHLSTSCVCTSTPAAR